jgi:CxxC motif-containing protein
MNETSEVTCIICPIGCKVKVMLNCGEVVSVEDIECSRGRSYAINEIKTPLRDFFTTVKVEGGKTAVLPVRTTKPVPKDRMIDCLKALSGVIVKAPVKLGSIICRNLLNLGVDVIATRNIEALYSSK